MKLIYMHYIISVLLFLRSLYYNEEEIFDAKYTYDGLHVNGEAYAKWAEFIAPYVNE